MKNVREKRICLHLLYKATYIYSQHETINCHPTNTKTQAITTYLTIIDLHSGHYRPNTLTHNSHISSSQESSAFFVVSNEDFHWKEKCLYLPYKATNIYSQHECRYCHHTDTKHKKSSYIWLNPMTAIVSIAPVPQFSHEVWAFFVVCNGRCHRKVRKCCCETLSHNIHLCTYFWQLTIQFMSVSLT